MTEVTTKITVSPIAFYNKVIRFSNDSTLTGVLRGKFIATASGIKIKEGTRVYLLAREDNWSTGIWADCITSRGKRVLVRPSNICIDDQKRKDAKWLDLIKFKESGLLAVSDRIDKIPSSMEFEVIKTGLTKQEALELL